MFWWATGSSDRIRFLTSCNDRSNDKVEKSSIFCGHESATKTRVRVSPEGQLELPAEIMAQLHPGDEYQVSVTAGTIVLKKVEEPAVEVDEWFGRIEQMEPDPDQLSLDQISAMVREVRQELW